MCLGVGPGSEKWFRFSSSALHRTEVCCNFLCPENDSLSTSDKVCANSPLKVKLLMMVPITIEPAKCKSGGFHLYFHAVQSDLFTTIPLVVLPYICILSDLSTTSPLVMLPYTSIQSGLFTTPPLVVLPYTSIQSGLFTTSPLVVPHTLVYSQTSLQHLPW